MEHPSTTPTVSLILIPTGLVTAGTHQNLAGVTQLVHLTADLSKIPTHLLPTRKGADGHTYYDIDFEIQITYYSAYTTYELIHNGINYGRVASEYV